MSSIAVAGTTLMGIWIAEAVLFLLGYRSTNRGRSAHTAKQPL